MSKTPLRDYLDRKGLTAEAFAGEHGLSPWSVRHWARGDKEPSLSNQIDLEAKTGGEVAPADWLAWSLSKRDSAPADPATEPARAA